MSHRAISNQQFGEQLKMFMSPDELIDSTNKMDSADYDVYENRAHASPRQQWEPLRKSKLRDVETDPYYQHEFNHPSLDTMPPVELTHYRAYGSRRPLLSDGHHRLAVAEAAGMPFMAVIHHRGEV